MNPESEIKHPINPKKYKAIEQRDKCCTKEVNPDCFMEFEQAEKFAQDPTTFQSNKNAFQQVFNCVHCNACKTSNSRYILKRKLHAEGFQSDDTLAMVTCFKKFGNPFNFPKYRVKIPPNIPKDSDTLFFLGCLSGIKLPEFTLHAIEYLLSKGIDFTLLDKEICCGLPFVDSGETEILAECIQTNTDLFNARFKKIICLCPACYDLFLNYYKGLKPEIVFIADLFEPLETKRNETLSIQHLCQMEYRGRPDLSKKVDNVLRASGYRIMENEKMWCCGGGMGIMHIPKTIDTIARIRMQDFHGEILTTYCVSCFQILREYAHKEKIKPRLVDTFKLLTE